MEFWIETALGPEQVAVQLRAHVVPTDPDPSPDKDLPFVGIVYDRTAYLRPRLGRRGAIVPQIEVTIEPAVGGSRLIGVVEAPMILALGPFVLPLLPIFVLAASNTSQLSVVEEVLPVVIFFAVGAAAGFIERKRFDLRAVHVVETMTSLLQGTAVRRGTDRPEAVPRVRE